MTLGRTVDSPDGRYRVDYWEDEVRMGWWISAPTIIDMQSGETIFSMGGSVDADVTWDMAGRMAVETVHTYTRDKFTVWLDPRNDLAWIDTKPDIKVPMREASDLANRHVDPLERKSKEANRLAQERSAREGEKWRQEQEAKAAAEAAAAPVEDPAPELAEPVVESGPSLERLLLAVLFIGVGAIGLALMVT